MTPPARGTARPIRASAFFIAGAALLGCGGAPAKTGASASASPVAVVTPVAEVAPRHRPTTRTAPRDVGTDGDAATTDRRMPGESGIESIVQWDGRVIVRTEEEHRLHEVDEARGVLTRLVLPGDPEVLDVAAGTTALALCKGTRGTYIAEHRAGAWGEIALPYEDAYDARDRARRLAADGDTIVVVDGEHGRAHVRRGKGAWRALDVDEKGGAVVVVGRWMYQGLGDTAAEGIAAYDLEGPPPCATCPPREAHRHMVRPLPLRALVRGPDGAAWALFADRHDGVNEARVERSDGGTWTLRASSSRYAPDETDEAAALAFTDAGAPRVLSTLGMSEIDGARLALKVPRWWPATPAPTALFVAGSTAYAGTTWGAYAVDLGAAVRRGRVVRAHAGGR